MKKILKGLICAALVGGIAAGCVPLTACGGGKLDSEERALQLALGAVDKKFNPMFYTAQNDGIVAGMTQASLMTIDTHGDLAFGENYPTIAKDYQETYYNADMTAVGYGDGKTVTGTSDNDGYTTYEFVIKNGVKFSDGVDLSVMDVLFNLYIYLDPAYSGSSTIYSTKIVGLQAYRKQDKTADDNNTGSDNSKYEADADTRYMNLYQWSDGLYTPSTAEETAELNADKAWLFAKFKDELETDWNSIESTWEDSFKENYRFTEAWQAYMFREGVVTKLTEKVGGVENELKDADGKYYTTLDEYQGEVKASELIKDIGDYVKNHGNPTDKQEIINLHRDFCIDKVYDSYANQTGVKLIMERWNAGAVDLYDYIIDDLRKKDHENMSEDDKVNNVSGITVYRSDKLKNEKTGVEKDLGAQHDILKIKIKGVDPKAKWNFSFSIAPMHYYSTSEETAKANAAYAKGSAAGGVYSDSCKDFGVKFDDRNWLDENVASGVKNKLPIGAGAYKATSYRHDGSAPTGTTFFYNNIAYFERNEYFTTLGTGIDNAKIKYVNYKVLADDKIIEALKSGEIDYGMPIAKASNAEEVSKDSKLKTIDYFTSGYGYIGINPKEVPDIEVRQAIMHAFDTSRIREYYGADYMNDICWPVSTNSWSYPKDGKTRYYERYTDVNAIRELIASSGNWEYNAERGKIVSTKDGSVLSLTFTIAGETTDHPAYKMFLDAETFLERCGMEIAVMTDIEALLKLATGKLSVWAAAWSSSIDPDPYQIYSKNSEASSTKNWYKDGIYKDPNKYATEYELSEQLSELIDEGRSTLNQEERKRIYAECYELIMQMAVEFPTYQRKDMCVYNSNVIDSKTFVPDHGNMHLVGPIDELWKVDYVK